MPVDQKLTDRMRRALVAHTGISEMFMMGGVCFFQNGNMLCGARRDKDGQSRFMFRVGKSAEAQALENPFAEPVIHGARRLGGFVRLDADACDADDLQRLLLLCIENASALPPKPRKGAS